MYAWAFSMLAKRRAHDVKADMAHKVSEMRKVRGASTAGKPCPTSVCRYIGAKTGAVIVTFVPIVVAW